MDSNKIRGGKEVNMQIAQVLPSQGIKRTPSLASRAWLKNQSSLYEIDMSDLVYAHVQKKTEDQFCLWKKMLFSGLVLKSKASIMHYMAVFASEVRSLSLSIYSYDWLWYKKAPRNGRCS